MLPTNDSRVKSLYEVDGRLTALELRRRPVPADRGYRDGDYHGRSDHGHPASDIIRQMQRDNAQTRRVLLLPDEARAYWYDAGLLYDEWDVDASRMVDRVFEESFPAYQSQRDDQMALNDVANPDVRTRQTVMMPDHEDVIRLEVDGSNGAKDISQQVHTVITSVKRTVTRRRTSYGPSKLVCGNLMGVRTGQASGCHIQQGWRDVPGPTVSPTAITASVTTTCGCAQSKPTATRKPTGTRSPRPRHQRFGLWTAWLNSQPMVMTSLALKVTRAGTADIHLCLCECTQGGSRTSTA